MENKKASSNFIYNKIEEDLENKVNGDRVHTRFPPEPNGYLHIGHAKAILINYNAAQKYDGKFNLRFDDTNPMKEDVEFVEAIKSDIEWLGCQWDELYFASDYFGKIYGYALELIDKGLAYVDDLSAEEIREYRGTLTETGKESPYRNRSIEENRDLFVKMKEGEFEDGSKVLRAKIDMKSPNMNMRDPVIYRIARAHHHNTGDEWCIYPMYDFAHPIEDAIEGITHSLCSLEFEDHRPLYDWVLDHLDDYQKERPIQMEFAKLGITNTILGKRHIKKLIDEQKVSGWNDPRLLTLRGLRRRGVRPEAIANFVEEVGVSKSNSRVDIQMLDYFIRQDLQPNVESRMVVLDPLKVVITNYPENEVELLEDDNNPKNESLGKRKVPFTREIYIERSDFMENPVPKYHRLYPGNEVRLRKAYFVTCNEVIKDENGKVIELRCTYDPETKSGSGFTGRKVKGTIHWVSATECVDAEVRLYNEFALPEEEGSNFYVFNEESVEVLQHCKCEKSLKLAQKGERFQFIRQGYFSVDTEDTTDDHLVFNQIVALKSSWKK